MKIIDRIWKDKIPINSILHIANETLSKYALLELLKKIYNKKEYIITSSDEQRENITLIASIEQEQFSNQIPILEKQIIELKEFYS